VAALHADERGDPARRHGRLRLVGGAHQLEVVIGRAHRVDQVDLLEGRGHRGVTREVCRHVDRPELTADPAGTEPGQVRVLRRLEQTEVALCQVAGHLGPQHPGQVVVTVEDRVLAQDLVGESQVIVHARTVRRRRPADVSREILGGEATWGTIAACPPA